LFSWFESRPPVLVLPSVTGSEHFVSDFAAAVLLFVAPVSVLGPVSSKFSSAAGFVLSLGILSVFRCSTPRRWSILGEPAQERQGFFVSYASRVSAQAHCLFSAVPDRFCLPLPLGSALCFSFRDQEIPLVFLSFAVGCARNQLAFHSSVRSVSDRELLAEHMLVVQCLP
jgi:hypothetical protein